MDLAKSHMIGMFGLFALESVGIFCHASWLFYLFDIFFANVMDFK